jgi:hypothetical protein
MITLWHKIEAANLIKVCSVVNINSRDWRINCKFKL